MTPGLELIHYERCRLLKTLNQQQEDGYGGGELAVAAVCYATPVQLYVTENDGPGEIRFIDPWPFALAEDKRCAVGAAAATQYLPLDPRLYEHTERIDLLAEAGALIAVEIERLMRLQGGDPRAKTATGKECAR